MAINFKIQRKGKVGEIIYPAYNGTNGFFIRSRWDLIVEVDEKGNIVHVRYIWDYATVQAIELIRDFKKEILK